MTRRTAAERHLDSAPSPSGDSSTDELAALLMAFHHPIRRWLTELLAVGGPANVGTLAARTGLAAGSVSHHLKVLHQQDVIEPAPDLARDTRESWWRLKPRSMSWSVEDFDPGSLGRRMAETAEIENFRFQVRATQEWLQRAGEEPVGWRTAADSVDTYVPATEAELRDLGDRLIALVNDWTRDCMATAEAETDHADGNQDRPQRRPVRAIARVFPSEPVRP